MTRRVTIWLTEKEYLKLEKRGKKRGVKAHEMATALVGRWLGAEFTDTEIWLAEHEIKTRREMQEKGTGVPSRIAAMLEEHGVMSTQQIMTQLGWARVGMLGEMLREDPSFVEVPAPAEYKARRGRQPKFWDRAAG